MSDATLSDGIGRSLAYAKARLVPAAGLSATADEIHQDYLVWCTRQALVPLKAGPFREAWAMICRAVGIGMSDIGACEIS